MRELIKNNSVFMISIIKAKNLKGKKVIVRSDLNVPIVNGKVRDGFRIDKALSTIDYLKKKGAKVIVMSHIGEGSEGSLKPVSDYLKRKKVIHSFVSAVVGEKVLATVESMKNGEILLIENLRKEDGEKKNDKTFAKALASLGDIYVNDAFPVSHRAHASVVSLPKLLPAYAGLQLEEEVKHLSLALKPTHPFLFVLGGAKISTKLPLLSRYVKSADDVFLGGALLNTVLRDKGVVVGVSVVDDMNTPKNILSSKKLFPIVDVVTENKKGVSRTCNPWEVAQGEKIMDVGMQSVKNLLPLVASAKIIVWNGPLGYYEGGYDKATAFLLKEIAKSKAISIIGGGDTVALVSKLKLQNKFTFVSTGGGATLDFLAKGTLPGIKVLQ